MNQAEVKLCPRCGENSLQFYIAEPTASYFAGRKCVKCLVCGFFSDIGTWNHGSSQTREAGLVRRIRDLEAKLSVLNSPMGCGHPVRYLTQEPGSFCLACEILAQKEYNGWARVKQLEEEKPAAVQDERERVLWLLDSLMARFEPWNDEWEVARVRRDIESGKDPRKAKE